MASMGLKYAAWARMKTEPRDAVPTYEAGLEIGKTISTNLAITNAEGELYANDQLAEYVREFASGALTMEVDNISLDNQATLYGATFENDELEMRPDDNAPYGGIGGYQVLMVGGVRKYRTWFFPKAKAAVPDWAGTTKGNSITFSTQPMTLRIMAPEYGPWYRVKEFTTEAAAKAHIDGLLGVTAWYNVQVQVQGAGTGKSAKPIGTNSVTKGKPFKLTIQGTPTALYDNGAESSARIADGVYAISEVNEEHSIAVIF